MALFDRTRTGEGRWVHTSLLESQIFMLDFQAARYLMKGEVAGQAGNDHPTFTPTGVFPASDGHMNIAASSSPLNFAGLPKDLRSPTAEPGAHTGEVLGWLGYSRDETGQLRSAGVTSPTNRGARAERAA